MNRPEFQPDKKAKRIVEMLLDGGAADCLFVGGFVRDRFLGISSKDIDIEVYGLPYERIIGILKKSFHVGLVGQSFGTVKVDNEIDLSIPRSESKSGTGHKGFEIASDPNLDLPTAFSRRDFTINAIGMRIDGTVYDPFDGIGDLRRKILRAPTEAFCEDPLRVLRGMQFAARFGFDMEPRTVDFCRRVLPEFETLSPERIWTEWFKWAVKGRFPGKGLRLLCTTNWISRFPELDALVGVPQNPVYHPEGDAFEHTCLTCDAAVGIADELGLDESDRAVLLLSALTHDFGKPATTIRNEKGVWVSPNHAAEGIAPAGTFLEKMRAPNWIVDHVLAIIGEHLAHIGIPIGEYPDDRLVRRLATRLEPSNIKMWSALCRSDALGCGAGQARHCIGSWEEVAVKLEIRESKPEPVLKGRDLLPLGFKPGPSMGTILHAAYEAQLDGAFKTHEEAMNWLENQVKSEKGEK